MYKSVLSLALFLCAILYVTAQGCQVDITETEKTSYSVLGNTYSLVEVSINNKGSSAVNSVTLTCGANLVAVWDLRESSTGTFVLPESSTIEPGKSHKFGYIIQSSNDASFTLGDVACDGGDAPSAPEVPTDAPEAPEDSSAAPEAPEAPTDAPEASEAPTDAPSQPEQPATEAPTSAPSRPTSGQTTQPPSTGGRLCPAGQIWSPAPGTTWQLQLTGTVDTSLDVQFFDIDLFDNDASTIADLHSKGKAVSCYFSSQYEDWRPDSAQFTSDILGAALDDWPGENWVDIRSDKLRSILTARMDLAVEKGCDAVDIDNVDEYQASNGLGITAAEQLDFNKFLAEQAHARGLSAGLKNDLDQIEDLVSYYDWSLNEQCNEYGECDMLSPFVAAGKAVFGVEYNVATSQFCPAMKTAQFSFLKKTLDLGAEITQCCTSTGGCSGAQYTCTSANSRRAQYVDVDPAIKQATTPSHAAASTVVISAAVVVAAVALLF